MTPGFPLIGAGDEGGINLSSFLPPQQTSQPYTSSFPTNPIELGRQAGQATRAMLGKAVKGTFLEDLFSSNTRYITGIIGLILIIAGVFLFRQVRETVVAGAKASGKVAALAA
jgi:hypothetical protein